MVSYDISLSRGAPFAARRANQHVSSRTTRPYRCGGPAVCLMCAVAGHFQIGEFPNRLAANPLIEICGGRRYYLYYCCAACSLWFVLPLRPLPPRVSRCERWGCSQRSLEQAVVIVHLLLTRLVFSFFARAPNRPSLPTIVLRRYQYNIFP